mmetsp:Transcript_11625/g.16129  ORF Transcript_11625/g.16129 Transcript_11625/m.16129 type:complete len:330 (+) Transcript_11625:532-1521(+)
MPDARLICATTTHTIMINVGRTITSSLAKMVNIVAHVVRLTTISSELLGIVLILILMTSASMTRMMTALMTTVMIIVVSIPSAVPTTTTMAVLVVASLMGSATVVRAVTIMMLLRRLIIVWLTICAALTCHHLLVSKSTLNCAAKLGAISVTIPTANMRLTHLVVLLSIENSWVVWHSARHPWWNSTCCISSIVTSCGSTSSGTSGARSTGIGPWCTNISPGCCRSSIKTTLGLLLPLLLQRLRTTTLPSSSGLLLLASCTALRLRFLLLLLRDNTSKHRPSTRDANKSICCSRSNIRRCVTVHSSVSSGVILARRQRRGDAFHRPSCG